MADSYELDPVDWITVGAVGPPGGRTFYVQARAQDEIVTLLVEKEQVAGIAQLAQELLGRVGVTVTPDDLETQGQELVEPVEPAWRAGLMSLGMDAEGSRFLVEAEEVVADSSGERAVARFGLDRDQLIRLAAYAAFVVEAGARETCRLCGRPVDPALGHVCPSSNGHGRLRS